jgi:hypothetical protein
VNYTQQAKKAGNKSTKVMLSLNTGLLRSLPYSLIRDRGVHVDRGAYSVGGQKYSPTSRLVFGGRIVLLLATDCTYYYSLFFNRLYYPSARYADRIDIETRELLPACSLTPKVYSKGTRNPRCSESQTAQARKSPLQKTKSTAKTLQ